MARIIVSWFLPRDAMRKRGLCCRPVSVRRSRWWIVSRWLKISSNFFLGPVAHHFNFSNPSAGTQFQGEPLQQGRKIHGAGKILRISTEIEIAVYLVEHYTIPSLSNGTTFNDFDWSLTGISRSRHFSTLNISETTRDGAKVIIERQ